MHYPHKVHFLGGDTFHVLPPRGAGGRPGRARPAPPLAWFWRDSCVTTTPGYARGLRAGRGLAYPVAGAAFRSDSAAVWRCTVRGRISIGYGRAPFFESSRREPAS